MRSRKERKKLRVKSPMYFGVRNEPYRMVDCVNCGESMNIKKVWKHEGETVCKKCYDNPYRMLTDEELRRVR